VVRWATLSSDCPGVRGALCRPVLGSARLPVALALRVSPTLWADRRQLFRRRCRPSLAFIHALGV